MQEHLTYNKLGYPQRRRMYQLNDHHHLNTSVQLHWSKSLQGQQPNRNKIIEQNKSNFTDKIVDNYSFHINKQFINRYNPDRFATIGQNEHVYMRNKNSRQSMNKIDENITKRSNSQARNYKNQDQILDTTLNSQINNIYKKDQQLKGAGNTIENSSVQRNSTINNQYQLFQQMYMLSPKYQKQLLLRSALDRPQIYSKYSKNNSVEYQPIKNIKPDMLQNYLRLNQKKSIY